MDKTTIDIRLIVDDREHTIHNELVKRYPNESWYDKQRLRYGDFAIVSSCECLLAIIERKTIADYGASIRDGRHKNKDKLMELRAKSQCNIYYIIEGDFYNTPDGNTFTGIPMSTIRSSVYNLTVRDSIIPLIVDDHIKTITNLHGLIKSYRKHHKCKKDKIKSDILDNQNTAMSNVEQQINKGGESETSNQNIASQDAESRPLVNQEASQLSQTSQEIPIESNYQTLLNELPINTIRESMLTTIPYITKRILPKLDNYSIKELCIDRALDNQGLLTPKMNSRFHITDATLFEKMLLCIPNMNKTTAAKITSEMTFNNLTDEKKLEKITSQAAIIKQVLNFKPVSNNT